MSDRRILEKAPDGSYETFEGADVQNLYADAFGRILSGPAVTKIEFTRVVDVKNISEGGKTRMTEERELFLRVNVPTFALIESMSRTLETLVNSVETMEAATLQQRHALKATIDRLRNVKL